MSTNVVKMQRTYQAKSFKVSVGDNPVKLHRFEMSGTLDGFIDFAMPKGGTFVLTLCEARAMAAALLEAADDVMENCLYDQDELLEAKQ